jgi:transposase
VDELARQHGHEVVRTPPYHPELQPIETCWGILIV